MTEPKKHHYLPQFYLRHFQYDSRSKKEQIVVWEKLPEASSFIAAVDSTGCKRDFHTIDHEDFNNDRASIESVISKVEEIQSSLVEDILKNRSIKDVHQRELPFFLSLMRHRNPSVKEFIRESLSKIVTSSANMLQNNGHFPDDIVQQGNRI